MAAYMSVIHWDSFRDGPARKKLSLDTLYAQSKLVNILAHLANKNKEGLILIAKLPLLYYE